MDVHRQGVELLQTAHTLEQHDDKTSSFDGFDGTGEKVGSDGFEVLQNAHAVGVSENLLRLLVVNIADVLGRDEELEGVLVVDITDSTLDLLLDFLFSLLAVTGEA